MANHEENEQVPGCMESPGTPTFAAMSKFMVHLLHENGFTAEQGCTLMIGTIANIVKQADLDPHEFVRQFYNAFAASGGEVDFTG